MASKNISGFLPFPAQKESWLLPIVLAVASLLTLGWLVSGELIIGNDYRQSNISYLFSYRAYQSMGISPTWYPHLEGGIPISSFVLAQPFHFPAWLLAQLPQFWSGDGVYLVAWKHLLLLFIGLIVLFYTLRRLTSLPPTLCATLSFLFLVHLRTLDCLRYGPFFDAVIYATGLACMVLLCLELGLKRYCVGCTAFSYLLLTSGYPAMVVYGGYAIACAALILLFEHGSTFIKTFAIRIATVALYCCIGLLIAAPHWLPLIDFLRVNNTRVAQATIDWANYSPLDTSGGFPKNLAALFANLLIPWRAEVHSAFGGSFLWSCFLLFALLWCIVAPKRSTIVFFLAFLGSFLFATGKATPIFSFFFYYVPGFSMSRAPGRILSILPILCLIGTVIISKQLVIATLRARAVKLLTTCLSLIFFLGLLPFLVDGTSPFGFQFEAPPYSPQGLQKSFWSIAHMQTFLLCSISGSFLLIVGLLRPGRWLGKITALSAVLIAVSQSSYLFRHGTWILPYDPYAKTAQIEQFERAEHLPLYGTPPLFVFNDLDSDAYGLETTQFTKFFKLSSALTRCFLPIGTPYSGVGAVALPFYFTDNILCADSWEQGFEEISRLGCMAPPPAILLKSARLCEKARSTPASNGEHAITLNRGLKLVTLTPNTITVRSRSNFSALFVAPIPAVMHWQAKLDDAVAELLEVNAGLWAVKVPAGRHKVELSYKPPSYRRGLQLFWIGIALFIIIPSYSRCQRASHRAAILTTIVALCFTANYLSSLLLERRQSADLKLTNSFPTILQRQIEAWRAAPH